MSWLLFVLPAPAVKQISATPHATWDPWKYGPAFRTDEEAVQFGEQVAIKEYAKEVGWAELTRQTEDAEGVWK